MTLEEMQRIWQEQAEKLEQATLLTKDLLRRDRLRQIQTPFRRLLISFSLEIALCGAGMLILGGFLGRHWAEPQFVWPAGLLDLWFCLTLIASVRQLLVASHIRYDEPIAKVQRQIVALRRMRLRAFRWIFLTGQLVWGIPFVITAFQMLFAVDAYRYLPPAFITANLLLGLLLMPLAIYAARRFRFTHQNSFERLADLIAGRSLAEAHRQIQQLVDFEQDSPEISDVIASEERKERSQLSSRDLAIDAARAFLVLLVVAHHAVLAYLPEAPPVAESLTAPLRWWQSFPIVDSARWAGFRLFVSFNDTFFMAALFLLSGLFVWNSLRRKGAKRFLYDRVLRLGAPFLLMALVIAPLAYYATYRQISALHGGTGFWRQWLALGTWPAGPAWFLWLLLAFDLGAAALFILFPKFIEAIAGRLKRRDRPVFLFALLTAVSVASYLPMALHFGPLAWFSFGPFSAQTSRLFHYFAYFLVGMTLGAGTLEASVLQQQNRLGRQWMLWLLASVSTFALLIALTVLSLQQPVTVRLWSVLVAGAFCLSCAASTFAVLAVCLRFIQRAGPLSVSLSASSLGIYVVHYACVTWLQYGLLTWPAPAFCKGLLVFGVASLLSWIATQIWNSRRPGRTLTAFTPKPQS